MKILRVVNKKVFGSVHLKVSSESMTVKAKLKSSPFILTALFSVKWMMYDGFTVKFNGGKCSVFITDRCQ